MERPIPQITWVESPPRPPFNRNLFDDLPPNPELDQILKDIVDEELRDYVERGIVEVSGAWNLGIISDLHTTGEPIIPQPEE